MSVALLHSPGDITRWLLIGLGLGADPEESTVWPIFATSEPDAPDNCLTLYDTTGSDDGSSMIDGELYTHHGVQVRIRAATHSGGGYAKASAIRHALAELVHDETVHVGATTYLVQCYARIGEVLTLGKDAPNSKRSLFTLNATVSLKLIS